MNCLILIKEDASVRIQSSGANAHETYSATYLLCSADRHWSVLPQTRNRCQRLCTGRPLCRSLAHRLCIRHILFFSRCIRRLCRTVWMEIRHFRYLGRYWQRDHRLTACMGCTRQTHPHHDPASGLSYHAPVFRKAFRQFGIKDRCLCHHLYFPDPVYRFPL